MLLALLLLATLAVLQSTVLGTLAMAALTPVIGWVSEKLYDGVKTIIPVFDRLPPVIHQVLAPLIGFGIGWLTSHFGLTPVLGLDGLTADVFAGALNAAVMAGIKRWEKSKSPGDSTIALEASRGSRSLES